MLTRPDLDTEIPRATFNLAIDSKLRGCDLVRLRVDDVLAAGRVRDRATVIQKKTNQPVQFEITEQIRSAIGEWLVALGTRRGRYLFRCAQEQGQLDPKG